MSGPVTVKAEDAFLAEKFWRVHPAEITATGMTREQWYAHHIAAHRQSAEAEFREREAALVEALEIAWAEAHRMRNASKLVGPYPNDRKAHSIWVRSLYHAGKDLCEKLKPYRQAARAKASSDGEPSNA